MSSGTIVACLWQPEQELLEHLRQHLHESVTLLVPDNEEEETLLKIVPEAEVIIGWRPQEKVLNAAKKLQLFINPGVGVKQLIPLFTQLTKERNIALVNDHGNTYLTAQHTVALLMSLMSRIVPHHQYMLEGKWRTGDEEIASISMRGCTVGLLGYGAINSKVHRFLSGFDMQFAALRNSWPEKVEGLTPFETHQLDAFLQHIDVLIIAVPHTTKTEGMIGAGELKLLGEQGLLLNVSRGAVVEEEALYTALKNNTIAGAAIDVWYNYQPEPDEDGRKFPSAFPFYELDNIVLSPHRGASPMKDLMRWNDSIENINRFAVGNSNFLNVVDLEREY